MEYNLTIVNYIFDFINFREQSNINVFLTLSISPVSLIL